MQTKLRIAAIVFAASLLSASMISAASSGHKAKFHGASQVPLRGDSPPGMACSVGPENG